MASGYCNGCDTLQIGQPYCRFGLRLQPLAMAAVAVRSIGDRPEILAYINAIH